MMFDDFFSLFFTKKSKSSSTGLGATGIPRKGKPKTKEERKATHKERYGEEGLPERGTGLEK